MLKEIMIKAIVFDWGGVMIDNPAEEMINYCSKILKVDRNKLKKSIVKHGVRFQKGSFTEQDFWKNVCKDLKINIPKSESLWKDTVKETFIRRDYIFDLIEKIKKKGYKLGFLSNTELPARNYFFENNYNKEFDVIIFSCVEGLLKPDKKIYEILLEKLDLEANEIIFIDDLLNNIEGANKIGIQGILYEDYEALITTLNKLNIDV